LKNVPPRLDPGCLSPQRGFATLQGNATMSEPIANPLQRKLISVVIPVFNEEQNVERAYEATRRVFETDLPNFDFEIIFTDNCSTDNTMLELEKIIAKDQRVRVASFTRNFGFNRSLITGYRLARGDAAIQLDCDLQDPPDLFSKFIGLWEEGFDVVVGLRGKRPEPNWLLFLRKKFYRMLSSISQDNLVVDGGDFRLVDRSILEQLRNIHDATPYVRGLISTLAANQTGFEYERGERQHGQSKFPITRLVGLAVDGIVSHSTLPLRLASAFGFAVALFAVLLSIIYMLLRLFSNDSVPAGFTTSIILELLSIGLNAIFLGVIGEYLGRIHMQLRQTPVTVMRRTINMVEDTERRE
jgi:glycosyltransferase involved in cell wall biosynthesis